ncbi:MAG: 1-acyl-sn-glycerol-3-phosphate acyltransferase [Bacteroidota bacterium]
MSEQQGIHPHVIPEIEDWPIYKIHANRKDFIKEIDQFTLERLQQLYPNQLEDIIAKTIYKERIRMKEEPWKVDPPKDRQFWRRIRSQLFDRQGDRSKEEQQTTEKQLLGRIIHRYSEEIVGTFKIKTFLFARRFLTLFFTRLLNTAAARNFYQIWGSKYRLVDRLLVQGEVDKIRALMKKGTVVVVPTHFSNLDSILIGYALDTFAGLPSFSYGAGLNLYNTGYTAYFMNRLGAYRVDRRKKNPIYLETLKAMSNLSVQHGTNSLFFPGGTRSRSGMLETKLKLGLLGTVVEAQRYKLQKGQGEKVFVVPLILSYHFVLEAEYLIEQHLKRIGKEKYIKAKDDFYSKRKILKFAWKLFSKSNDIILSVGQPMDVLGNYVDEEGESYDQYGNQLNIADYFKQGGEIVPDFQREAEYTRLLSEQIVDRYFKDNIVLTSHLVAFAAFELLKRHFPKLDLYGLLSLPTDDFVFDQGELIDVVTQLKAVLVDMQLAGKIKLAKELAWEPKGIIHDGLRHLGNYHVRKPLRYNKQKEIISDSFKVLYYYHNRLENYGLAAKIVMAPQYV